MKRDSERTAAIAGGSEPGSGRSSSGPGPGRFRSLLGLAVVSLLILLAVAGLKNYRELAVARSRQALLEQRIEETRARNRALDLRLRRLETDPATLEHLAREDLRMARPGDVIILLPEELGAVPAVSGTALTIPAGGDG